MNRRERRRAPPRLSAGELTHLLLGVCELGVAVRERAACLGVGLAERLVIGVAGGGRYRRRGGFPREIRIAVAGPRSAFGAARELQKGARHARSGHDDGCLAFGVPLSELRLLAERWATPDSAAFTHEVFGAAAGLVAAGTDAATADAASVDTGYSLREAREGRETGETRLEALRSAVGARITPVVPPTAAVDAIGQVRQGRQDLLKEKSGRTPRGLRRSAPQPPRFELVR